MSFMSKLTSAIERNNSLLCVGLDPKDERLPEGKNIEDQLVSWGTEMVNQTADLVCAYKPNYAFFEQHGPAGLNALQRILAVVPEDVPVLLDVKRGDIGSTAKAYAKAAFEQWGADAVTLNPYLGVDSVAPFLEYTGKAAFLLCYTSNPSAGKIQMYGEPPLFEHIARNATSWGTPEQIGLVVGATQPQVLLRVREICPQSWILAPGVGAQGGDLDEAMKFGLRPDGSGIIVPVSRGVMMADDPRQAAENLRAQIGEAVARRKDSAYAPPSPLTKIVQELFATGCVKFGNFTLASGKQSPIYIDLRRVVSYPFLFKMVTQAYADVVGQLTFDQIAGVPYAALPTGSVVAWKLNRSFIYPRKEAKKHGTGQLIEGSFKEGQRVIVLEDVITSGGSIVSSVEVLRNAGLTVSDVVVLVDREQGGADKMAEIGLNLHAVMTISDVLAILKKGAFIDHATYQTVQDYLNEQNKS